MNEEEVGNRDTDAATNRPTSSFLVSFPFSNPVVTIESQPRSGRVKLRGIARVIGSDRFDRTFLPVTVDVGGPIEVNARERCLREGKKLEQR